MKSRLEDALSQRLDETLALRQTLERLAAARPEDASELQDLVRLAHELTSESLRQPSAGFGRAARVRLLSRLPSRPVKGTVADRIRAWASTARLLVARRMEMKGLLIAALGLFMFGGGARVAYAADGAVPGDALYGLDRAIEKMQWGLTFSPEGQAALGLSLAEERLLELQALTDAGAAEELVQFAAASYGESVRQAAEALAAIAAEGGEARSQAVANVIAAAQAIHTQALNDVLGRVPEQAQESVEQAIVHSQGEAQGGPPEFGFDAGQPPLSFEQRVVGLGTLLTQAQADLAQGDVASARIELQTFESEVNALAQELAAVAQDDPARAQILAELLDEALMLHEQVLSQLITQVPAQAVEAIQEALAASQAGLETVAGSFGEGMPGDPPDGVPDGPPDGYGP